jgi:hypothetical protein
MADRPLQAVQAGKQSLGEIVRFLGGMTLPSHKRDDADRSSEFHWRAPPLDIPLVISPGRHIPVVLTPHQRLTADWK